MSTFTYALLNVWPHDPGIHCLHHDGAYAVSLLHYLSETSTYPLLPLSPVTTGKISSIFDDVRII